MRHNQDPLFTKLQTLGRTVSLDAIRQCPIQSIDPNHYSPAGPCLCRTKRTSMITTQAVPEQSKWAPPRPLISRRGVMRPTT